MQATLKFSDLLALGAALIACGGIIWQVQDHGTRIGRLETEQTAAGKQMATMSSDIKFLVEAEKRRSEGK